MLWKVFVLPFVSFIIGWKIIPKFYNFGRVSTFDYISYTFSPMLSRIALSSMILGSIYYMSNVAYIPALILNAATGYSIYAIIPLLNTCCLLYTVIGGINAVLYTDCLQAVVLIISIIAITIQLVHPIGVLNLFSAMEELNGNSWTSFSWDVNMRNAVPIFTLCQTYRLFMYLGTSQIQVQRFLMCRQVGLTVSH